MIPELKNDRDVLQALLDGYAIIARNGIVDTTWSMVNNKIQTNSSFTAIPKFDINLIVQKKKYFIGDIEVPAPLESVEGLEFVYSPNILTIELYSTYSIPIQVESLKILLNNLLQKHLLYQTKEDAILVAKAILKIIDDGDKVS